MTGRIGSAMILLALVVLSALGVVYNKHQGRTLFVELQALREARDSMDVEWGQLQLEQSTHTTHGKVETAARTRLGMEIPAADRVVILRP